MPKNISMGESNTVVNAYTMCIGIYNSIALNNGYVSLQHFLLAECIEKGNDLWQTYTYFIYPLSHMPVLGFSNSAANKDMMSKI